MKEYKIMCDIIHPLQQLLTHVNLNPYSYSGRGMFGKKCLAVSVADLGSFMAEVIGNIAGYNKASVDLDLIVSAFKTMRHYELGFKWLVVYFPYVEFVDPEEDDLDDDEDHIYNDWHEDD